jgi:hypothetical protein
MTTTTLQPSTSTQYPVRRVPVLPQTWETLRQSLQAMSEPELRSYLAERLRLTAENLVEMALVIREFDERGIDLSDLRLSLLIYLRRIAYGQTLPEVVAALVGRRDLLQRIAFLPLPEQARCFQDEGLAVTTQILADGTVDARRRRLMDMEPWEVRQVFGPNGIRNELEQAAWLKGQALRALPAVIEKPTYVIEKKALIIHRPTRLTKRDLTHILAAM